MLAMGYRLITYVYPDKKKKKGGGNVISQVA